MIFKFLREVKVVAAEIKTEIFKPRTNNIHAPVVFTERKTIKEWQREVYETAKDKGWHSGKNINLWKYIGNIHGEVSEAWEEIRKKDFSPTRIYYREKDGKPEGLGMELADVIIRCMDTAEALDIDLEKCIDEKNRFNKTRPFRHGGKRG